MESYISLNTKYRAKAKKYDFEKNEYKFLNNSKLDIVKNKVLYGSLVMKKWKNTRVTLSVNCNRIKYISEFLRKFGGSVFDP